MFAHGCVTRQWIKEDLVIASSVTKKLQGDQRQDNGALQFCFVKTRKDPYESEKVQTEANLVIEGEFHNDNV